MAVEKDQSAWLPEPPPPHPARRDAAIAAALRKFDGADEPASIPGKQTKTSWAGSHRPQLAILVSAMLLVVIGIPAALIGLRNPPRAHESTPHQAMYEKEPAEPAQQSRSLTAEPNAQFVPAKPSPPSSSASSVKSADTSLNASAAGRRVSAPPEEPARATAPPVAPAPPAPIVEAAPPPPPPPPPPPAPQAVAGAEKATGEPTADNLVVTGSRVPRPGLESPGAAKSVSPSPAYRQFLPKLQAALGRNDRRAVIKLVDLPLRVNFGSGPQLYRDRRSLMHDFDRIFTARVKEAVLGQRPDSLFVRDQGAMVGNGELWFRETCPNSACSPLGPVRIVAVNP